MAAAVLVSAVALVMQAILLFATYRATKATKEQVTLIAGHAESLVLSVRTTLESSRKQIAEVTTKASEVLDLTKIQLVRVDEVLSDATTRARVQLDRVELVLDDTIGRVQDTAAAIQNGILRPLREINGVAAGISAALSFLFSGRRVSVEQATHDEEMFI
jgi:hypothetical protein